MKITIKFAKMLSAAALFALSSALFAGGPETYTNDNDVAVSGYDAVAYFTESKAKKGSPKYTTVYEGAIYQFASAENRDLFAGNPGKYAPQYGGFCAFGLTLNRKFATDPEAWYIEDGKLYLNLNKKVQENWVKDVPGNIKTADGIWPEIIGSSDAYLESIGG